MAWAPLFECAAVSPDGGESSVFGHVDTKHRSKNELHVLSGREPDIPLPVRRSHHDLNDQWLRQRTNSLPRNASLIVSGSGEQDKSLQPAKVMPTHAVLAAMVEKRLPGLIELFPR